MNVSNTIPNLIPIQTINLFSIKAYNERKSKELGTLVLELG